MNSPSCFGAESTRSRFIIRAAGPAKHMELVTLLKQEHGMGHGHANALVAYLKANNG